ncbi:MAG: ABC transporter ATP-binding protein [Actinobacteria bacterium]|jgi:NitT/TauT family transport system ATP-binding protein|nr:ABC transporter ATP-binding protein [Actinomycetota bacterium]
MGEQHQLVVQNVSLEYEAGGRRVVALSDVSLQVSEGEFVAVIGPSGCGKSTLIKIVADLLPTSRGVVSIAGVSPAIARKQRRVGVVFQSPTLLPWRTVLANVRLGIEIAGKQGNYRNPRELVELVGLGEFSRAMPTELSGGMQQRVAIARALVLEPELLLMDEPFGALDEFARVELGQMLLRVWQATASTIVFITHSVEEAVTLADRIIVFSSRPGTIIGEVRVDLPRPRTAAVVESDEAFALVKKARHLLSGAISHWRDREGEGALLPTL